MKPLTDRQHQILDYIEDHVMNFGYPPTLREIARRFDLSGPRAAVKHLDALQRKGCIRRSPGASRAIEVLPQGKVEPSRAIEKPGYAKAVPVLGTVPAGPLDLALETEEDTLILDPSIAGEGSFLLKVRGDSMTGDHILPGDMVLIRKQDTVSEGDLVVVLLGDEATLKRFHREGRKIILMPSNQAHAPVILDGTSEELKIIGKVKAVIRITDR